MCDNALSLETCSVLHRSNQLLVIKTIYMDRKYKPSNINFMEQYYLLILLQAFSNLTRSGKLHTRIKNITAVKNCTISIEDEI